MARWDPDSRSRLQRAALELFSERGYEQTTVAEIAERAGLTERTFFRHFADKREVLFADGGALRKLLVDATAAAPDSLATIEVVAQALEASGPMFEERRAFARQRQQTIAANAELRERELIKLAALGSAIADGLRQRGIGEPAASLAAEAGMAAFRIAFERWVQMSNQRELAELIRESIDELRDISSARSGVGA